jgi:uncharacterized SAM-binding protein YcdF (DUF218 family)
MFRRLFRSVLTLLALVLLAGVITLLFLAWRVNRTGTSDEAQPVDAIVILGARVERNGQPGPDLRSRTRHAARLYHQGLAPYLICTGGYEGDRLSAAAVARRLAISLGVPKKRILRADGSMTTSEDAASARELMAERGWDSAILVSHPLHLERARQLFEGEGIEVFTSPTSTDLQAIPWRTRAWLTAREVVGIVWMGLEGLGMPNEWTAPLSRWVYGAQMQTVAGAN